MRGKMKKQVYNPYLPSWEYVPDGEPHVFGDRVYVYASHDKFGSPRYCPGDYVVWSAPVSDLSDWSNPGTAYSRFGVRNRLGIRCMWAPDCVQGPDGRFYLYYCFDFDNRTCVAVSHKPDRDFEFYGYVHHRDGTLYGQGPEDIMCFDPGLFRDEDGRIYLFSGYSANEDLRKMLNSRGIRNVDGTGGQGVELEGDMLTVKGSPFMTVPGYKNSAGTGFEGHEMYEASSMRKLGGRYYFFYSTRLSHELGYAMADSPRGPFTCGGAVISNGDVGYEGRSEKDAAMYWGNVHGSVEYINGEYYVFYHRQTNKNEQTRQGCAEKIEMDEKGRFRMAGMTSQGLYGGPLPGRGEYPAYAACSLVSARGALKCAYGPLSRHKYAAHPCITEYRRGRQCIREMQDGARAGFKYFDLQGPGEVAVTVRGAGGKMLVSTEERGEPIGEIALESSGAFGEARAKIALPKGKSALYFTYKGPGKIDFLSFGLR